MIDFCNTTDAVKLENDLDLVVQQIDMLLGTNPHEVLGDPGYGSDFYRFLWDLNYTNRQIKMYMENHLAKNIDFLGFGHSVKVDILHGTENDIILLTINLFRDGWSYEKIYNIR